ncbi:Crp/Fnr family transcriptional regulator [Pelomonas sp. SE-A7]|uniref:Crp/Fnr family transcriptional regulator n=1 Tax=Pelomonas sp. SE-A7 TaxID=3054953 RepID=UPI00259CDA51|nr:Crp/Fnr family transcriptional regulator [Pelomonas sp. SE-A7]MDM4767832.1 Crp/Fnr family transcriptional regulator [Pelomonas sp. SE-A7]
MMNSATVLASSNILPAQRLAEHAQSARRHAVQQAQIKTSQRIADALALVSETLKPQRQVVRAGDVICQAGERFQCLYLLNSGFVKIISLASDGREQVVGLRFRGDWLGFDGIATQAYGCDAVAMDTGEIWAIRYDELLAASLHRPALLGLLHQSMSREIATDRDSLMSVCTLPADARVADFLRYWADSLAQRGLRTDQIKLRMTRAEIGNYLGMTLETVSRALSRLAKNGLIEFAEGGRRDIQIPDVAALSSFVQGGMAPAPKLLQ